MTGHLEHAATVIHPGRALCLLLLQPLPNPIIMFTSIFRCELICVGDSTSLNVGMARLSSLLLYPQCMYTWMLLVHLVVVHLAGFMVGSWMSVNIATEEFVPVVTAAALWGRQWAGSHVCFHVDNLAVVSILNKRSAKDTLLSQLLRCLFFFSAFYKFYFSAKHSWQLKRCRRRSVS